MKDIKELTVEDFIAKEKVKSFKEVEKKDATYKHICYHDEKNPRPCRRIKL